jgi:F420-dependent oxidoreductase-like protein
MIEGQEGVTWDQWVTLALACEEFGLEGLFRSDHYVSFGHEDEWGSLDAWATLSALASKTERIRLGTMVSPVTFRHPSELAKVAVTADHASGGRIEMGMGAGWFEREHRAYGFDFPATGDRLAMLEEQVEIVHRLWDRDESSVTYDGRFYHLDSSHALPRPLQDPHPPLILGGGAGARAARLAARFADEYNVNGVTPDECRGARERLDRACEAEGRDPAEVPLSMMVNLLMGRDRDDLRSKARALMARQGRDGDPDASLASRGPERLTGTVAQVAEQLRAFADAGVTRVMLQHLNHEDLETVALAGQELVPAVASL